MEHQDKIDILEIRNKLLKADYEASEQENAELKAENEQLKALCDTYRTCYQAKHNDIDGKLFKYRKTLQEIKEIIHEQLMWQGQLPQCELEILRKITKAEEE